MKKHERLEVTLEKMVSQGYTLAHAQGETLFIRGGIPGEKVSVSVVRKRKGVHYGIVKDVLVPAPSRISPNCPVYLECGGCSFLHIPYQEEIRYKEGILNEIFAHKAPELNEIRSPLIPMDSPIFYRNKMEYSFGELGGKKILGLHRFESHIHIVPATGCLLQGPFAQRILSETLAFVEEHKIPIYNNSQGSTGLRYLVIREGKGTGEILLHLVTSSIYGVLNHLTERLSVPITTYLISLYGGSGQVVASDKIFIHSGPGYIYETIGRYRFRIGPYTFFQANTRGAEVMFGILYQWAKELEPNLIMDLYSGSSPIGIHLHPLAHRIIAVEGNPSAVEDARENLVLNGVENVEIVLSEVERYLVSSEEKPELAIVDPPRAGLSPKALRGLIRIKPPHIFYVSCNPHPFLRDYTILKEYGYKPRSFQPVDLFPRTFHLEILCHLSLDSL